MYNNSFLDSLSNAHNQIENMVVISKQQQIRNFEALEILLELLNEIQVLTNEKKIIPTILIHKWNSIYGKSFRWFEGVSIENDMEIITETINSKFK